MPSLNPNGSVSVGSAWQSWRQIALIPGDSSRYAFRARSSAASSRWRVRRDRDEHDVDVRRPERRFPVLGAALAGVAQRLRARGHPLPELPREAVERVLRHAEGLEALVGERDADPGIGRRAGRVRGRGHDGARPPHQLPPGLAVVDAEQDVGGRVRRRPRAQDAALDVIQLEHDVRSAVIDPLSSWPHWRREVLPEALQALVATEQRAEDGGVGHSTSPARSPLGGIQRNMLNSRFPASVNGCGLDRSIGCLASTWMDFASSVVTA